MPNLGKIRQFLEPCDLEIWHMTLKTNRAPLLCYFKLCAWFHCHMWIQTGVTVWKRLSWVLTSVTLTFDLWPWPFARTSLLSMVITPENFIMIWWGQHSEKGVTDGQTDGLNQSYSCLDAAKHKSVSGDRKSRELVLISHTKTFNLVLLYDLRNLMGNISLMMKKHIVVPCRIHCFAYLIIQIILCC